MNYLAVYLCADGGISRNANTQEVMNLQLGEFESRDQAISNACELLDCTHTKNGVLVKGQNTGGFLICDTQEFAEL
ncbi:hypothetical protein [Photobacterium sp. TY1-4]|uniref:hypothetical protein n=1 Tax=Photobacterium sp. TY1-4 TaxID=2899122 RepID=UPI0021C0273C|nr:hypothetical protein [Photobacterium sp. TY1-4]UXI00453.1 hypothetical protein NH461_11595 [Photobacterium sp. TY1-4]